MFHPTHAIVKKKPITNNKQHKNIMGLLLTYGKAAILLFFVFESFLIHFTIQITIPHYYNNTIANGSIFPYIPLFRENMDN